MTGPATNVLAVVCRSIMWRAPTLLMFVIVTHRLLSVSPVIWHLRRIAGRVIEKNRIVSVAACLGARAPEISPPGRRGFSLRRGSLGMAVAAKAGRRMGPGR